MEDIDRYRLKYESLEFSQQISQLKALYSLFHAGGATQVGAFECCNNGCSITMMLYLVLSIFVVQWSCFFPTQDPRHSLATPHTNTGECNVLQWRSPIGGIGQVVVWINIVVMFWIVVWSSWCGWNRWKQSVVDQEHILSQLGNWPEKWKPIEKIITKNWPSSKAAQVGTHLSSDQNSIKILFHVCGIQAYSWKVSRFLIWALKSTMCIHEDSVWWDESLDLGMHQIRVDIQETEKRIKIMACLLLLCAPFFVVYFSIRMVVTHFYNLKTGKAHVEYKWTSGAHSYFCRAGELPHETRERLSQIQEDVEKLKKCRQRNLVKNHFNVYVHFCTSLLTITFIGVYLGVVFSNGQYEWNESIATSAGLLSALHLLGQSKDIKLTKAGIKKLENKVLRMTGCSIKEVECYLNSRTQLIAKELMGIVITPIILITHLLPKLTDVKIAFEMNSPWETVHNSLSDDSNFDYSSDEEPALPESTSSALGESNVLSTLSSVQLTDLGESTRYALSDIDDETLPNLRSGVSDANLFSARAYEVRSTVEDGRLSGRAKEVPSVGANKFQ